MEMKELSLLLTHAFQNRNSDVKKGLYPVPKYPLPGFYFLAISPIGDKCWACDPAFEAEILTGNLVHMMLFVKAFYESVVEPLAPEFRRSAIDEHYGKWMIYSRNPSTQLLQYDGRAENFLRLPKELPLRSFGGFS